MSPPMEADQPSEPMVQLVANPYDYNLHANVINTLKSKNADYNTLDSARNFMAENVPLSEQLWLEWINDTIANTTPGVDQIGILELYKRAFKDYLSIPIYESFAKFVLTLYYSVRGLSYPQALSDTTILPDAERVDEALVEVIDEDFVRGELFEALPTEVRYSIPDSHKVWNLMCDFEMDILTRKASQEQVERLQMLYRARLAEPHATIDQTWQDFSTFTTAHDNAHYEQQMIENKDTYNASKKKVDNRDIKESYLHKFDHSIESYTRYLYWEQKIPEPEVELVITVFERAITKHFYSVELWKEYINFVKPKVADNENEDFDADTLVSLCDRAVRNVPTSGDLCSFCMRALEAVCDPSIASSFVDVNYKKVMSTEVMNRSADELIQVVLERANFERRLNAAMETEEEPASSADIAEVIREGILKVRNITKNHGDSHVRLEKYICAIWDREDAEDLILKLWQETTKKTQKLAAAWHARADFEAKRGNPDTARKVYKEASKKRLDYPEFLFEAWKSFEQVYGTLAQYEGALSTIASEMKGVIARRTKEAARNPVTAPVETPQPTVQLVTNGDQQPPAATAPIASSSGNNKRPAEEEATPTVDVPESSNKRAKTVHEAAPEQKRDRENSTVFVSGLPSDTDEDSLRKLFADCGEVREVKVHTLDADTVATVEFMEKDSVLAALTKDKKRINKIEVNVHLAWKSTLYITNFPEGYDDARIRALFSPYGTIFDTRWPNKRFKSTRRFCYVQYTSPSSATDALVLHHTELEPKHRMNVFISDPNRKTTRSDADLTDRELYITGLAKHVNEGNLQKIFEQFGTIKAIRIGKDEKGDCKGFAFLEFETKEAAKAGLSMNNTEIKKRRMAVTIADKRVSNAKAAKTQPASGQSKKADAFSRSIEVTGFPENTQEPLLQQVFEKHGKISSVVIEGDKATVEFENVADVGTILLHGEPIKMDSHTLSVSAAGVKETTTAKPKIDGEAKPTGFVPRAAGTRGGRGRGRGRGRIGVAQATARAGIGAAKPADSMDVDAPAEASGKGQDDFRALLLAGKK